MIKIECRLYAALRKYTKESMPGRRLDLELPDETTLAGLYDILSIPHDEVKRAFVNGCSRKPDHVLSNGNRVALFPPIAGG